jgi:hypothetical protein
VEYFLNFVAVRIFSPFLVQMWNECSFSGQFIVWLGECILQQVHRKFNPRQTMLWNVFEFSGCAHILPFPGAEVE